MLSSFWDIGIGWQEWLTHVDTCFEVMGFDLRNELRPAGPFSGMLGCWAVSIDPFGVQAMFGQNGVATRALQTGAAAQLLR